MALVKDKTTTEQLPSTPVHQLLQTTPALSTWEEGEEEGRRGGKRRGREGSEKKRGEEGKGVKRKEEGKGGK